MYDFDDGIGLSMAFSIAYRLNNKPVWDLQLRLGYYMDAENILLIFM